jgi:hypothetical protein
MDLAEARREMTSPDRSSEYEKAQLARGIRDGSLTYPDRKPELAA